MFEEELSQLIGEIYDAALDQTLWHGVLTRCRHFVDGMSATLYAKDAAKKSGDVYYDDGGIDPHFKKLYFEKYVKLDPVTAGHYFAQLGEPVSTVDVLPYEEFVETRFYKEWVQPQGIVDFLSVALDKTTTNAAMFGVFRNTRQGLVDDEMRRRILMIVPHIRRAVLIGRTIDLKTAEAATMTDVLDGVSAGMFLVDSAGRIVHANMSGHGMLARGDVLRMTSGRLSTDEAEVEQTLKDLFAKAADGDAAVGVNGIAVHLSTLDDERHVAHVLPLTCGRRRAAAKYAAVAAVFVQKATLELPSPPEVIAQAYKLTASELRVMLAIVQVGGVPETSEALGIGEATVKTHLNRLFAKTGCRRQAELVKLVAGFSSPLHSSTTRPVAF